jgi:tRNA dimethylallyltransferase
VSSLNNNSAASHRINKPKFNLITILGPTAVGKTKIAAQLAKSFNGEIISADSRQIYKGMDIGTGKDLSDYEVDGVKIKYHLIDLLEPSNEFNLYEFNKLFYQAFEQVTSSNKTPFLVGGTGLYLHSILGKYDLRKVKFDPQKYNALDKIDIEQLRDRLKEINPGLHNTTDLLIKDRIIRAIIVAEESSKSDKVHKTEINSLNIGIYADREIVKKKITLRLKHRLENGMIEEVEKLIDKGITIEKMEFFGLEYKFIARYLTGRINYNDMFQKLNSAIHNFAKRQMTWFRKMEKEEIKIFWIEDPAFEKAYNIIFENYFEQKA